MFLLSTIHQIKLNILMEYFEIYSQYLDFSGIKYPLSITKKNNRNLFFSIVHSNFRLLF